MSTDPLLNLKRGCPSMKCKLRNVWSNFEDVKCDSLPYHPTSSASSTQPSPFTPGDDTSQYSAGIKAVHESFCESVKNDSWTALAGIALLDELPSGALQKWKSKVYNTSGMYLFSVFIRTKLIRLAQNDPLLSWLPYCNDFLNKMMQLEGRHFFPLDVTCNDCKSLSPQPLYCCDKCLHLTLVCCSCCL
jgi:hypothetical protein